MPKYNIKYLKVAVSDVDITAENEGVARAKFINSYNRTNNTIYSVINISEVKEPSSYKPTVSEVFAKPQSTIYEPEKKQPSMQKVKIDPKVEIEDGVARFHDLVFNFNQHKIFSSEKNVSMSGRESSILRYLLQNVDMPKNPSDILVDVFQWDDDRPDSTKAVSTTISRIRKKLAKLGTPVNIDNIRGQGYILAILDPDELR